MTRFVFPVACAVFVLLHIAQLAAADSPQCYQYGSCYECTDAPSGECGWESDSQQCVRGSSVGPKNGASSNWVWTVGQCCQYDTCTNCLEQTKCGWDANQYSCMVGGYDGPYYSSSSSWVTSTQGCPSSCQSNFDCSSCLSSGYCGWDSNSESCYAGTMDGAYNYVTNSWHFWNCPSHSSWSFKWSVNSVPLWLAMGGGVFVLVFFVALGRRRRRVLREQQLQQQAAAGQAPYHQPVLATAAAPLMGGGGTNTHHQDLYGANASSIYSSAPAPPPMPYYGAAPTESVTAATADDSEGAPSE